MRVLNGILAFVFILFGYWQFNDPDALTWVILYFAVAGISLVAAFREVDRRVLIFFLMLFFIYVASYSLYLIEWVQLGMPSIAEEMQANTPYIERTREFFGLLICLLVMIYHYFSQKKIDYYAEETIQ